MLRTDIGTASFLSYRRGGFDDISRMLRHVARAKLATLTLAHYLNNTAFDDTRAKTAS